ncbi:carbamoyltransferase N-terminal domain-containing protein [Streptomyces indonesiensis]
MITVLVLGLNGNFSAADTDVVPQLGEVFFHDSAASLIRDGELVAAVEEERLNRIKRRRNFPSTRSVSVWPWPVRGPRTSTRWATTFPRATSTPSSTTSTPNIRGCPCATPGS